MEETLMARLAALFPQAKKTTLREMVEKKRVRLNGAVARSLKQPITPKDVVEVADPTQARRGETTLAEGLRLVHFDADIVIVDKPPGLLTATDKEERRPTTWRILTAYFRRQNARSQIHLIHRLDRDASGLLVFARNWDAYAALKKQFFEHTITRQYDVIVHGIPKERKTRLEDLLKEDDRGVVHTTRDEKAGKLAILNYEVVDVNKSKRLAHLKCSLHTGRKHQIRVQLKAAGHNVCGDSVYGTADEPPGRLALHASHLAFEHPRTGCKVRFDSVMPGSFAHLFA